MSIKKIIDEDLDYPDEISIFHVIPDGEENRHTADEKCWCVPTLQYKNPELGNEIWKHVPLQ